MEPKHERTPSEETRPAEPPAVPKKRFRIEKLEERIAPKKKGQQSSTSSGMAPGVSAY